VVLVMGLFTKHVFVEFLDLPHVPMSDSATPVSHKHVPVNKSDGVVSDITFVVPREAQQRITHWLM
jgi:hypothetical protein